MDTQNFCVDCGKSILSISVRCNICNCKHKWNDNPIFRQNLLNRIQLLNDKQWKTDFCRKAMSDRTKLHWTDPIFRQFISENTRLSVNKQWADPNSTLRKSLYKRRLDYLQPSSLEMKFKVYLDYADIAYIQQYRPKDYNRAYDFCLPDYNALVEIDGMVWHHSKLADKRGQPQIDAEKDKWAYDHGFIMVRIPENELTGDVVTNWLLPELCKYVKEIEND
jgi:very-short-patch-repair endonuclease